MKKFLGGMVAALAIVAGILGWSYWRGEAKLREQVRQLEAVVGRLTAEYRVAQVLVRDRAVDESGRTLTSIEFRELDRDGHPLPPLAATLVGEECYFEALVIQFKSDYVEKGDALRGKSVILFRRMFGSATAPDAGIPIDPGMSSGIGVPSVYRVSPNPSAVEIDLWNRFWFYANHPKEADAAGVRVLQIDAVGVRPAANMTYEIRVQNNGGMGIVPLTTPAEP